MTVKRVTIRDVAEAAGCSRQAAGFILGGQGHKFRPEMVDRVEAAAAALGYRPNTAAHAFRSGRFSALGLLLSTERFRSSTPPELVTALVEELEAVGHRLVVGRLGDERLVDQAALPELLTGWSVDAFLVKYDTGVPEGMVDALHATGLPAVWINAAVGADHVVADDGQAALRAVRELGALGHRRVVYLDLVRSEPRSVHGSRHQRLAGYLAGMEELGAEPTVCSLQVLAGMRGLDARRIWHESGDRAAAAELLAARFAAADRPTAVIGYSGSEIALADHAATRAGLAVPQAMSLVSLDSGGDEHRGLRLGGSAIDHRAMAHAAVALALARVEGRPARRPDPIPLDWHRGDTVAPAP